MLEAVRGPRETSTQREAAAPPGCWASPFGTLRVVFSIFTGAAAHPQHAGEGQPEHLTAPGSRHLHRHLPFCKNTCPHRSPPSSPSILLGCYLTSHMGPFLALRHAQLIPCLAWRSLGLCLAPSSSCKPEGKGAFLHQPRSSFFCFLSLEHFSVPGMVLDACKSTDCGITSLGCISVLPLTCWMSPVCPSPSSCYSPPPGSGPMPGFLASGLPPQLAVGLATQGGRRRAEAGAEPGFLLGVVPAPLQGRPYP